MSDGGQVLKEGYGTPLAWLFNSSDNVLLTAEGRPLSGHLVDFEYIYDEEEDDICNMKFEFENIEQMNLPYLVPDVILLVQWGYILPNGERPLKSPKRKVAIRDIKTRYDANKLEIELKCTDLVAYIKSFKTATTRKFENPNAEIAIDILGTTEDNYIDWTKELIEGSFVATITNEKKGYRIDQEGQVRSAEFDERSGRYTPARENTAMPRKFYNQMYTAEVINGKGKAIPNQIRDYLRALDATKGVGGPYIMDTTDDALHMKQRNFLQKPYKNYTFGKGTGELISFDSSTDTRKVKEDITATNSVDPTTKLIDATQVVTIDNSKFICVWPNGDYSAEPIKIDTERIDKELDYYRRVYKNNWENPLKQRLPGDLEILNINKAPNNLAETGEESDLIPKRSGEGFYAQAENLGKFKGFEMVKIPHREILMLPYSQRKLKDRREAEVEEFTNSQELLGYAVEKIQRKYEATVKVIGDPSLIKGKIYGFFNLSKEDSGLWYATRISHRIQRGSGYMSELNVLKKPATITISRQAYNSKLKEINGAIEAENKEIYDRLGIYEEISGEKRNWGEIDENYETETMALENNVESMKERLDYLNSEERFTLGKSDIYES